MICSYCFGEVTWRGPLSNLTHTECSNCGRQNCQRAQEDYVDTFSDRAAILAKGGDQGKPLTRRCGHINIDNTSWCPDCELIEARRAGEFR